MRGFVILLGLALASCVTSEQQQAQSAADDRACLGYGAVPGSAAYSRCRDELEMRRTPQNVRNLQRALERVGNPTQTYDVTVTNR
jgi:hypothetical protein